MSGGQDEAANLIDTSEIGPPIGWTVIKWDPDGIICESPHGHRRRYETALMADTGELIKLREYLELLETAVKAWERGESAGITRDGVMLRQLRLEYGWHTKAKEAIDEQ